MFVLFCFASACFSQDELPYEKFKPLEHIEIFNYSRLLLALSYIIFIHIETTQIQNLIYEKKCMVTMAGLSVLGAMLKVSR